MDCNQFQAWLSGSKPDEGNCIPSEVKLHTGECRNCARSLKEETGYHALLDTLRASGHDESFWDDYLETVINSADAQGNRRRIGLPRRWLQVVLVPAAAAIVYVGMLLTSNYLSEFDNGVLTDKTYAATLDMIWEEYDMVMAGHIFDPTSLYSVEDFIPENWDDGSLQKQDQQQN